MIRILIVLLFWAGTAPAQDQIAAEDLSVSDQRRGVSVQIALPRVVPYRVFVLDTPRRLVVDIQGVTLTAAADAPALRSARIPSMRHGAIRPGWYRMIFDLVDPALPTSVEMRDDGGAVALTITMRDSDGAGFAARAGAPPDPGWDALTGFDPDVARALSQSEDFVVFIDASHGGIDRGEVIGGVAEADLTLLMARELAARLAQNPGIRPVLSREGDFAVPTDARLRLAQEVGTDLLISLEVSMAIDTRVSGVRVLTSPIAGTTAPTETDNPVDTVLSGLAAVQTRPLSNQIAQALIRSLQEAGVGLAADPRQDSENPILSAATFPAVILSLGYLSNNIDRAALATPAVRARLADALTETVLLVSR